MNRNRALELIGNALGERRLIWLGMAGEDAGPLLDVPQFSSCYCVHSPLCAEGIETFCVETLTGQRQRDYDIALFLGKQGRPMVESFGRAINEPSVVITSTPYEFLPLLLMDGIAEYAGNSYATFRGVSDKRLVEAELQRAGVLTIPWQALPDDPGRLEILRARLRDGALVLRCGEQDGGAGHELIRDEHDLQNSVIARLHESVFVAPYLADYLPICIGACVFADGGVTVHTPSFQLIGIPGCSPYDFGFCGNDFGAAASLTRGALDTLECCVRAAGEWLHTQGYIGTFGVDALIRGEEAIFVEVNPRFLGSSRISASVDHDMDFPDVYLDHLMACLGLPSHPSTSLAEQAAHQAHRSQIICHNQSPHAVARDQSSTLPQGYSYDLLPAPSIRVAPESLLFVLRAEHSVTRDGKSIHAEARAAMDASVSAFLAAE